MEQDNPTCICEEVVRTWEWRDREGDLYHTTGKPERCRHGTLALCCMDGKPFREICLLEDLAAMKDAEEGARMKCIPWKDADGTIELDYQPKGGGS